MAVLAWLGPGPASLRGGIEIAQWFTPDREASLLDVAADGIGIAIYGAVRQLMVVWIQAVAE